MKLTARQVATMFDVSERTIERWIRDDEMPHHLVQGRDLFHRAELLEWANEHRIRVAGDPPASVRSGARPQDFANALEAGGIHYRVPASDRESLLKAVIARMPLADEVDAALLFDLMLAREKSGSTGVGDGIAIPHVRSPIVLPVDRMAVTLCFLEKPVAFDSIDGNPVDTVFNIVSPTIRAHHAILARLSGLLHDPEFRRAVLDRAPAKELLGAARRAEDRFTGRSKVENGTNGREDIEKLETP